MNKENLVQKYSHTTRTDIFVLGYFDSQWLWSRIRDGTNDCLWSLQPIRKPTQQRAIARG